MMKQTSRVEQYQFHNNYPIEKSIYLSKEGEEILPISIKPQYPQQDAHIDHIANSHVHPHGKKITISQINTKKESSSIWDIFGCCKEDNEDNTIVSGGEYDDCYVCNRRVFHVEQASQEKVSLQEEKPYTSAYRMRSRQEQAVQVFYDKLQNHELKGERWREL